MNRPLHVCMHGCVISVSIIHKHSYLPTIQALISSYYGTCQLPLTKLRLLTKTAKTSQPILTGSTSPWQPSVTVVVSPTL
jgi:hypothetical protein